MRYLFGAVLAAVLASPAAAGDCDPGRTPDKIGPADAAAIYDCIRERLHESYPAGLGDWRYAGAVRDSAGWVPASAFPAPSAAHGGRFLFTRVSEPGASAYMQYAEDPDIPVGTMIAAESFAVTGAGEVEPGPLFLMEKVDYDRSPETMGWYYMAVAPDGTPMGIDPWADCNDCHVGGFPHRGGLGYPPEAARLRR